MGIHGITNVSQFYEHSGWFSIISSALEHLELLLAIQKRVILKTFFSEIVLSHLQQVIYSNGDIIY